MDLDHGRGDLIYPQTVLCINPIFLDNMTWRERGLENDLIIFSTILFLI